MNNPTEAHTHLFFHYTSSPPSTADLTTWSGAVMASWVADMLPQMPTTLSIQQVVSTDLATPGTIEGVASASHSGTYPGAAMTAETAVLINFVIARKYRGGKPRIYIPAGSGTQLNNPVQWQSTFTSAFESAFTNFVNSLLGVGGLGPTVDYLANVSYYSGKTERPTPVVDKILSWSVNGIPASQRRRMGR
jgi:hypothetical protein